MNASRHFFPTRSVLAVIGAMSLMIIFSCGEQSVTPQGATTNSTTLANGAEVNALPRSGKLAAAVAPPKAVFGMIWLNTAENREYIFDGTEWVPHDQSVDAFYAAKEIQAKSTPKTVELTQDEVCVDGDPLCTPTGAHAKHGGYACSVCHKVAGRLVFDKSGLAYKAGSPTPTFDATAKSCTNIACHSVPAGTFSYYFVDGTGEAALNTVTYGGGAPRPTPSWYATGAAACTACHDDPPRNYAWHSGVHGGQGPTGTRNQCQFCHPDASSPGNGIGTTITNAALHANGAVNVRATFTSACFGCH